MVFNNNLLLGAAGQGGDYIIDQSIRFNDNDSAYLTKTFAGAGDDATAGTVSVWYKRGNLGSIQYIFANADTNNTVYLRFESNDIIGIVVNNGGTTKLSVQTTAVYRDVSSWYHLVFQVDTSQGSASARRTLWVNGVEASLSGGTDNLGLNEALDLFQNNQHYIGRDAAGRYLDGYLSEYNGIDGQALAPTDFGKYNSDGVWVPKKYTGSYGTNGFYITGEDSADLGADYSGNGNDFTSSGLTSADQVIDTPTNNFCTWNPLNADSTFTFSQGNTLAEQDNVGAWRTALATIGVSSGKWVWEVKFEGGDPFGQWSSAGIAGDGKGPQDLSYVGGTGFITFFYASSSSSIRVFDQSPSGADYATGISSPSGGAIMFLLDMDSSTIELRTDNTSHGTYSISGLATPVIPFCNIYAGGTNDLTLVTNESDFTNTVPAGGYKTLNTANLPTPAIADGSAYFQTTLYAGNSSNGHEINQSGNSTFTPGLVWIKDRDGANQHHLFDQVRGVYKRLRTSSTGAESTETDQLVSFDSDGFTLDDDLGTQAINRNSNYVAWQWKANGSGSSNTDGSITSTVSANTTAGFSIVSFTGTGTAGATVGHGLGVEPDMIILKFLNTTSNWSIYHKELGNTKRLVFTTAASTTSSAYWNNTSPTSSVFTLGTDLNQTYNQVVYCFASVEGFSKFGRYTGNGSSNGSFVWCGFRPAFVMTKRSDSTGNWTMFDNQREGYNVDNDRLRANTLDTETTTDYVDILSNGFKLRSSDADVNASGGTYLFMAFAEHPFGGDGVVPVPAR